MMYIYMQIGGGKNEVSTQESNEKHKNENNQEVNAMLIIALLNVWCYMVLLFVDC